MPEALKRGGAIPRSWRPAARISAVLVALLATALLLGACGSSKKSSTTTSSSASSSSSGSSTSSSSSGSGKSITIGTKNFTEEYILGELYAQVLAAKGYKVSLKENIGSTEITDKALTSGQIDAYPEYTGESVSTVAKINTIATSAQQEYSLAEAFYNKRGQAMSQMTPFYDTDDIATTKAYATAHHLTTITDLAKLPHFVLGAAPEFLNRQEGALGLRSVYGVKNFSFKSLAEGLNYQALDTGGVDAADVFTTDPQLASGKYTLLTDPKHIFGYQNIAFIINKPKLAQLGGQSFMNIINQVNALLTTQAMVAMNKAVAIDKQSPTAVAKSFLTANHLT